MKCFMEKVRLIETGHVGGNRQEDISLAKGKQGWYGQMNKNWNTSGSSLGNREEITLPRMDKAEKKHAAKRC